MNFLLSFDIFTFNTFFLFQSNKKVASYPGLIVSFFVYAFLLYSFCISDMIKKTNPKITDLLIAQPNKQVNVELSNENLFPMILISDKYSNYYRSLDPTIWTVVLTSYDYFSFTEIPLVDCNSILNSDSLYYNKSLCISNETRLNLNFSNYITITVSLCYNSTNSDVICKTDEEIKDFVQDKTFELRFSETTFDLNNYDNPVKEFKFSFVYSVLNANFSQGYELSLMPIEFSENKNILSDEYYYQNYFQPDMTGTNFAFVELKNGAITSKNSIILEVSLFLSVYKRTITRKYQQLTEVLAQIGGLLSVCKFFGTLFLSIFPQLKLMKTLLNELYLIQKKKTEPKNDKKVEVKKSIEMTYKPALQESKIKESHYIKNNDLIDENINFENPNSSILPSNPLSVYLQKDNQNFEEPKKIENDDKTNFAEKKLIPASFNSQNLFNCLDNIKKHIEIQEKASNLDFSFFSYLKNQIKSFFKVSLDFEGKTITTADKVYQKEVDVVLILKRIQDVEKLKFILLSKEHRKLFELMKPSFPTYLDKDDEKNRSKMTFSDAKFRSLTFDPQEKEQNDQELIQVLKLYEEKIKDDEFQINEIDGRLLSYFKL